MRFKYDISQIAAMIVFAAALVGIAFIIVSVSKDKRMSKMETALKQAIREQNELLSENIKLKKDILKLHKEQSK